MINTALGAVLVGCLAAWAVAPTVAEVEAERAACAQSCARTEPEGTDRTTCTLVCDTRADNRRSGPTVTRWKTEKRMGGPLPGVPVGHPDDVPLKTTTTTTTTTTTVITSSST